MLLLDKRDQRYYNLTARRHNRQLVDKSNRLFSNELNSPITQSSNLTAITRLSTADLHRCTIHVIIYAISSNNPVGYM